MTDRYQISFSRHARPGSTVRAGLAVACFALAASSMPAAAFELPRALSDPFGLSWRVSAVARALARPDSPARRGHAIDAVLEPFNKRHFMREPEPASDPAAIVAFIRALDLEPAVHSPVQSHLVASDAPRLP